MFLRQLASVAARPLISIARPPAVALSWRSRLIHSSLARSSLASIASSRPLTPLRQPLRFNMSQQQQQAVSDNEAAASNAAVAPASVAAAADASVAVPAAAAAAPVVAAAAPAVGGMHAPVFPAPLLQPLLEMGFPLARAHRGLYATSARSVEDAMSWIIQHSEDADIDEPLLVAAAVPPAAAAAAAAAASSGSSAAPAAAGGSLRFSSLPSSTPFKLVLLVRMDLHMRTGKIAAQTAHAAVGTVLELQQQSKQSNGAVALHRWLQQGQAKVVLQIRDQAEMHALEAQARAQGIATHIVQDAGRTQVASGSETVLAIGPAPIPVLDTITGHLKLL